MSSTIAAIMTRPQGIQQGLGHGSKLLVGARLLGPYVWTKEDVSGGVRRAAESAGFLSSQQRYGGLGTTQSVVRRGERSAKNRPRVAPAFEEGICLRLL